MTAGADRQLAGAQPLDRHVLLDEQLAAGQVDGSTGQAGGEDDRVAIVGLADLGSQGAGAAVGRRGDGQRAGTIAAFQHLQLKLLRPDGLVYFTENVSVS
jgi:hypothetical protein